MDLIGKATIHPILFYTGKISGYITWIIFLLSVVKFINIPIYSTVIFQYVAFIICLLGLTFSVVSMKDLGSSTRLGLPKEETVFKTNGLYKYGRNPMYLGFNLLTIASMLYTANIYIIIAGLYSLMIYHLIILSEEKFLENRFGKDYIDYKNKTRRYI